MHMAALCVLALSLIIGSAANATPAQGKRGAESGVPDVPVDEEVLNKRDLIYLPIPSASPNRGFGLAGVVALLYDLDEESQTSLSGLGVYASTNGSWAAGGLQRLNWGEDVYRFEFGLGYADVKYDFYGVGNENGDAGLSVPIGQRGWVMRPQMLVRIWSKLFVGVNYRWVTAATRLRLTDEEIGDLPSDFPEIPERQLDVDAGLLGFLVEFDTRDNEWNPKKGVYFEGEYALGRDNLGNDFNYERMLLSFSHYIALKQNQVLAYNVHVCSVWGDPPFFDLCQYGANNTLRGYDVGRYRDFSLAALQAEWRWQFQKKWGLAVFAGVGAVAPNLGKIGDEGWLPSAGVGIRYVVSETFGVNIGVDYARGKNSDAVYIRIGEAF